MRPMPRRPRHRTRRSSPSLRAPHSGGGGPSVAASFCLDRPVAWVGGEPRRRRNGLRDDDLAAHPPARPCRLPSRPTFCGAPPRRPTRSKARRWPTAPARDLAPLCAHARPDGRRPDRRRRLRPLPPHAGGRALMQRPGPAPPTASASPGAACCPRAAARVNAAGLGFYERLVDALARARHRAAGDALPLGPAGRARRPRRLAQPRHRRLVRRLRARRSRAPRRPRAEWSDAERALGRDRRRLPARRARAGPHEPLRGADRRAPPAARARRGRAGLPRRRRTRRSASSSTSSPSTRRPTRRRRSRRTARRRLHEPAVPRPGRPRRLPRRDARDLRRGLARLGRGRRRR